MKRQWGRWSAVRSLIVLSSAAGLAGCLDTSGVGPGPDDDVRIAYVGAPIEDSIGASISGIRFFVSEAGSEDLPLANLRAFFAARGEGCGEASVPSSRTDDDGFAETTWQLGDATGECELRMRVLNASGLLLAFADVEGNVIHGQAELLGWLARGESVTDGGSLGLVDEDGTAFDRLANDVPWGFRVVSGPARVVGGDLGSAGARTLVPTGGTGTGQVIVESRWGDAITLDLCVQDGGGEAELRLHWTLDGANPPACGG